jgi:HSP20 family protein
MSDYLLNEEFNTQPDFDINTSNPSIKADLALKKTSPERNTPNEGHLTVDVLKDGNNLIVQSTIAGTDPKDIDISITKDSVTIKGSRKSECNVTGSNYYHQELYWGSFSRSIILPLDIDPDQSKANIKNGVLTITLPKLNKVKKINIDV